MATKTKTPGSNEKVTSLEIKPHYTTGDPLNPTSEELIATWSWNYANTASFEYTWEYTVKDVWINASSGTTDVNHKNALYTPPESAIKVRFSVKPVSKTYLKNNKETNYWTISSYTKKAYTIPRYDAVQLDPPTVEVELNGRDLTLSTQYDDENAMAIEYQLIDDSTMTVFTTVRSSLFYGKASYMITVPADHKFRARCRAIGGDSKHYNSEWSSYSSEVITPPENVIIYRIIASSDTSVKILVNDSATATTYEINYAENIEYFGDSNQVSSVTITVENGDHVISHAKPYAARTIIVGGLPAGSHLYFRVKASNDSGSSAWSNIADCSIGSKPNAPTIWSSEYTAVIGNPVILYWTHNATDGSNETNAKLTISATTVRHKDGMESLKNYVIEIPSEIQNEEINTFSYVFYPDAFTGDELSDVIEIKWSCQTKGIYDEYSPVSVINTIKFYPKPEILLRFGKTNKWYWDFLDLTNGNIYTTNGEIKDYYEEDPFVLSSFPLYIEAQVLPLINNRPIECFLRIYAEDTYQTLNHIGETIWVTKNTELYSTTLTSLGNEIQQLYLMFITAKDVILENNQRYCFYTRIVTENGLLAETEKYFTVDFEESEFSLNAEISYDPENVSTYIQPYCVVEDDEIVEGVFLSVYRKNFDGSFVEVASEIDNTLNTTVVDPHPTLKKVLYRIAAYSIFSGKMTFTDLVGYPIPETAIVIQWDEAWSSFESEEPGAFTEPVQSLSILKLPYNIDTSESNALDATIVEYIGRKHPVSYYGTQVGQKLSLKSDIDAEDLETLYQLRRLAVWPGDVYIREPSGNGYHAQISVSFSTTHTNVVIPVSIEVTRVEGGV